MLFRDNRTNEKVEISEGIGGHMVIGREPYFVTDEELEQHFTRLDDRRANPSPRRQQWRLVDPVNGEQRRQSVGRRRRDSVTAREDFGLARENANLRRDGAFRRSGGQRT